MRELSKDIITKIGDWNRYISDIKNEDCNYFELKLRFKTPRAGYHRIYLDSILTHFAYHYVLGKDTDNLSFDHDMPVNIRIPLSKEQFDGSFFHKGSCINTIPQQVSKKTKRFIGSIPGCVDTRRISTQVGSTKSFMIDVPYDKVMNYSLLGLGHIETIKNILPQNMYIGKSTAIGYGQCEREIIEKGDYKKAFPGIVDYRKLIRPMPCQRVEKYFKVIGEYSVEKLPISPPYFGPNAKYYNCYKEGTRIEKI